MKRIIKYRVKKEATIQSILKTEFKMSGRFIRKLKDKHILVNDKYAKTGDIAQTGSTLIINLNFIEEDNIKAENIPLNILYEDEYVLAVNKPPNMVVHPTCLHQGGTLANAVKFYFNSQEEWVKIRLVNRLDKDTSGVVILAKTEYIQEALTQQMKVGVFRKEYIGIVEGIVEKDEGVIDYAIKRDEESIMLRKIDIFGKRAITNYRVIKRLVGKTVLKYNLETGRTHQIRVHSKAIGHPIVGDDLYGRKSDSINRQALHAESVEFVHPVIKEKVKIYAPLPEDMERIKNTP